MRFQFGTSKNNDSKQQIITTTHGGRRFMPWAFNEQGVAMLSAVLNSETAVEVSIQIMGAFVEMRKMHLLQRFQFLLNYSYQRISNDRDVHLWRV